jgi:hypothetical protein
MSMDRTEAGACAQAMRTALTQPAGDLPPRRPVRVLCGVGHRVPVAAQLAIVLGAGPLPEVTEVVSTEAEDIFDSFVGHMAGRAQPEEFPDPGDWAMLVDHADAYRRAAPWRRWTDQDHFDLVIRVDDTPARYVAIVIGAEVVQHGLVLYPGGALPDTLVEWRPGAPTPVPAGSILFYLDSPVEAPQEFVRKPPGTAGRPTPTWPRCGWPPASTVPPISTAPPRSGSPWASRRSSPTTANQVAATDRPPAPAPCPPAGRARTPSDHRIDPADHR